MRGDSANMESAPARQPLPETWHIGSVELRSRVLPAPMCNISDRAFRGLMRAAHADLVTTQMISAEGLIRNDKGTWALFDLVPEDPPVSVQLLGSRPDRLAEGARILEAHGATIIDLNLGCPARKITGNDCGSALMRSPDQVVEIVRAIRAAIRVPLTVKMRAGWDGRDISAVDLARRCEAEGADAVTLHARTREQGYSGRADWTLITKIKQALGVPVIGNGDITSPADAVRMVRETGCDAVMIGRGLIGNPWLLKACDGAIRDYCAGRIADETYVPGDEMVLLDDGETHVPIRVPYYMKDVSIDERLELVLTHTRLMIEMKGERRGVLEMRKHSQHYVKGLRGCKLLRQRLMQIESYADLENLIREYASFLHQPAPERSSNEMDHPRARQS